MLFPRISRPYQPPRVVVTGAGIVTALGVGWQTNVLGFRSGRTAFCPVTVFDVSRQRVKIAAQVQLPNALPTSKLSARQAARLDRAGQMLLWAVSEAWQECSWEPSENLPLVLGTTAGGMSLGECYFRQAMQTPTRHHKQPTRALHYQAHTQARIIAEALGCRGPITILSDACATGTSAIGYAWEALRRGNCERILTGGYDALSQMVYAGFDSLQTLSPTTCKPFDAKRDGLLLGEGAAVLALETLDSAQRRGANILGEIIGYGSCIDLHHLTQPQPQGDAALASMVQACEVAGITPEEVGYVNAHGTGTPLNDSAEAAALGRWAGKAIDKLAVSSTKANIGHLLGAAGSVEAAICLMALKEQWLPPERTLETLDPDCAFSIVRKPVDARFQIALSNSFGFGGVNATLILRRWS